MYITRIKLTNIRCIGELSIELEKENDIEKWLIFVGDNGDGKTSVLRSIAMGLCDASSAAGLLRESDQGYIRRGKDRARIRIELVNQSSLAAEGSTSGETISIDTRIEHLPYSSLEFIASQTLTPKRDQFRWDELFACAYGAGRGTTGTGDFADYSLINSVYSLFNYGEGLQNPELTIRRLASKGLERRVLRTIETMLPDVTIRMPGESETGGGIQLGGPWGDPLPLRDIADGYKSTFLWITDFIGWALAHHESIKGPKEISGIVLIDELEQHLHPKWQRTIVSSLRDQFPNVQFIVSSHSPLVCQAASFLQIYHVPPPGSGESPFRLTEDDYWKVVRARPEPLSRWCRDSISGTSATCRP